MATSYGKDIQLPYHLDTMTTGVLPSDSPPKPVPEAEIKKKEKRYHDDSLVRMP